MTHADDRNKAVRKVVAILCDDNPDMPVILTDLSMVCAGVICAAVPAHGDRVVIEELARVVTELVASARLEIQGIHRPS